MHCLLCDASICLPMYPAGYLRCSCCFRADDRSSELDNRSPGIGKWQQCVTSNPICDSGHRPYGYKYYLTSLPPPLLQHNTFCLVAAFIRANYLSLKFLVCPVTTSWVLCLAYSRSPLFFDQVTLTLMQSGNMWTEWAMLFTPENLALILHSHECQVGLWGKIADAGLKWKTFRLRTTVLVTGAPSLCFSDQPSFSLQ